MPPIGYVPQRLDFDRGMPITVLDFLAMATQIIPVWFGVRPTEKERALRFLKRVQADHLAKQQLGKLSGGELQRVQLALALQSEPQILLLDEPVAGVDVAGEHLFCDLLDEVRKESKLTMVMVSHDLSVVSRHAEHVICLNRRLECTGPTPMVLNASNLQAIYGPHAGLYDHEGAGGHGHPHSHAHHHHHHHPHDPQAGSGETSWNP
jgi:zinc transport system ATP-binding protein